MYARMKDPFTLMMIGIGIAYFMFYVFFPFIGWIFKLEPKPTIRPYTDWSKKLEQNREWLKNRTMTTDDHVNVIYTPDNICPDCSSEGCVTSGGSMITNWKCVKCHREWMTINELKND